MRGFKIPVDDRTPITEEELPETWEGFTELLGGYMEIVHIPRWAKRLGLAWQPVMIVDEEGLLKKLPFNRRATALYTDFYFGVNMIAGGAYLLALQPNGDFAPIPPDFEPTQVPGRDPFVPLFTDLL